MKLISSPCSVLHLFIEDRHGHRLAVKLNWGGKKEKVQHNVWHTKAAQKVGVLADVFVHLLLTLYEDMMHAHIWAQIPVTGSRIKGLLYGFKLFCSHCSAQKLPHLHPSLVTPLSLQGAFRKYSSSLPCLQWKQTTKTKNLHSLRDGTC